MNLRPTTLRRLGVLLAGLALIVGIASALYFRNEQKKAQRLAEARNAGIAAFKSGDYRAALDSLKFYVARVKSDPEALYAYGVSRSRIEAPGNVTEAISVLHAVLQIDPSNADARHQLLHLYNQAVYPNEAIDLADRILADHPDDREAMKSRVIALARLHKLDDALAESRKLNDVDPTDLEQQLATLQLSHDLKRPPAEAIERIGAQKRQHPDDPRFDLLLTLAFYEAGDNTNSEQALQRAISLPPPDATFVRHMVAILDQLKLYQKSQTLLDQAVAQTTDPLMMRVLIQRLWQNGRDQDVVDRLKTLDHAASISDTGLLAYRALALFDLGQKEQAQAIVAALTARRGDPEAIAWGTALKARFDNLDPKSALAQYQAALVRAPDNAVIRFLVGEAYARLGEQELAISAWTRAAELTPSWATPHMNIARALANSGHVKEAVEQATLAYQAAPQQPAIAAAYAAVRYRAVEEGQASAADEAKLLEQVTEIQKQIPAEAETLPIYVNLLARAGRKDDAIAAVKSAAADGKKLDQTTVLRLLAASRNHKLGLEEFLHNAGNEDESNPRVALMHAADLAATGKTKEGFEFLQARAKKATTRATTQAGVSWELAVLQYKELTHDAEVAKEWTALGEAHPNDLAVQTAILKNAASVRGDRDFIARTIDRVRALTGPEGQTWKIERARWLIGSDSPKDAAEAVNTLSDIVRASPNNTEARVLLAGAYEAVGNLPAAAKELSSAAEQSPQREEIALDLARLLQMQGKFADARTYLDRVAHATGVTPEARRRAAGMLAQQGDFDRAAKALESAAAKDPADTPTQLLLAQLYARQGRARDAGAIYDKLLAQNPPGIEAIQDAADFLASSGRTDEAAKVIARVGEAHPPAGTAQLLTAQFNDRWGNADAARRAYLAATAAAPKDPSTWRHLIAFHLRHGAFDLARQSADDAGKALPDDATIKRMRAMSSALVQLAAANPPLAPVFTVLAGSPEDRGVIAFFTGGSTPASNSGEAISPAASQPSNADGVLSRLKELAPRHPRSMALQAALVQCYAVMHQLPDAAAAAERAAEAFPTDTDLPRIASELQRQLGKLDRAAADARLWLTRSADNPGPARLAVAEIEVARGDASAAIDVLAPVTPQLIANPRSDVAATSALLRAYAAAGRADDAQKILQPLLASDRVWRMLWLQIASLDLRDTTLGAKWIGIVEPMIGEEVERIAMADAWCHLAARTSGKDSSAAYDAAAKVLDPIVGRQDAPADAIIVRGMVCERSGDVKGAQELYRRALRLQPKRPETLNNLAYLILEQYESGAAAASLSEAKSMADQAVRLAPTNASFLDTLARIQLRVGDRDAAIASFRRALSLDPQSLDAMLGLATAMVDAGQRNAAADLLPRIELALKTRANLSPQLRKELDALRATTKASL